jgi:hypothetical protein
VAARDVRVAIRDYIAPTPGITRAFKDEPHFVGEDAWYDENGVAGTVAYVHIDDERESRFALTGSPESGQQISYDVSIVILYQYLIPTDEADPADWVDGLDDLIAALKARLRADPTMGTGPGGAVFMAAQEDGALHIARDLPKRDNGIVRSWNVLQFKASELLTG